MTGFSPRQSEKAYRKMSEVPDNKIWMTARIVSLALSALLLLIFYFGKKGVFLAILSLLLAAWYPVLHAAGEITTGRFLNGPTFMSVTGIIAFLFGFRAEGTMALILYAVGSMLRESRQKQVWKNIRALTDNRPRGARLVAPEGEREIDAEHVSPGDTLTVRTNEKIPVDGILLSGSARIDPSDLMGADETRKVRQGEFLPNGAVNVGGKLQMRATATLENSTVDRVLALVRQSAARKTSIEMFLEKRKTLYTVLTLAGALIAAILLAILTERTAADSAYIALILFFVFDINNVLEFLPLCYASGVAGLAGKGVLVAGGARMMQLRKIKGIIFNRSGVLTEREYRLQEIVPHNNVSSDRILYYAAAAEQISEHRIARAICAAYDKKDLPVPDHELEIGGEGVCVAFGEKKVYVGNDKLMRRAGIEVLPYHGQGVVCFVGVNEEYLGCIVLNDPVKNASFTALDGLFGIGVQFVDLVTGDRRVNAENTAALLGIHRTVSDVTPEEKAEKVRAIVKRNRTGGKVAFVGDGKADEACLRAADISFATGTLATDAAVDSADVVLLSDSPLGVFSAIAQSFKIHRIIRTVTLICFALKFLFLIALLVGLARLWIVVLADAVFNMFAIISAGRCLYVEDKL